MPTSLFMLLPLYVYCNVMLIFLDILHQRLDDRNTILGCLQALRVLCPLYCRHDYSYDRKNDGIADFQLFSVSLLHSFLLKVYFIDYVVHVL